MKLETLFRLLGGVALFSVFLPRKKEVKVIRERRKIKPKRRKSTRTTGLSPSGRTAVRNAVEATRMLDKKDQVKRLIAIYRGLHNAPINPTTVYHRLKNGWKLEQIVCTPVRKYS